jgi:hypothetical protein
MEAATNKPRVFVSSTIVDFRDLRSALKYWLESLGLDVRMSEFNDFTRQPDQGTFDSCFGVVADCHYYVLLIGTRKGSNYSAGVSVTQQEYRVAAELARQRRITPIIFIRRDVRTALRERKKLRTATGSEEIATVPTTALEDPEFIQAFVEEIERTESGRKGEDPSGTIWIYQFHDFRDIADALRNNLRLFGSVPRHTLLANLEWELKENIAAFCGKRDEMPDCGQYWLKPLRSSRLFSVDELRGYISLDPSQAQWVGHFLLLGAPEEQRIRSAALHDAISSREFLMYSQAEGQLVRSPELDVMYMLDREIERYRSVRAYVRTRQTDLFNEVGASRSSGRPAQILGVDLMNVFGLADFTVNILRISFALLDYIADPRQGVTIPTLIDLSPFGESTEHIKREQVSHDDVGQWRIDQELREHILN